MAVVLVEVNIDVDSNGSIVVDAAGIAYPCPTIARTMVRIDIYISRIEGVAEAK